MPFAPRAASAMVMDVTGMVTELRLELDRIERSILILEALACPSEIPLKRGRGYQARFAGRPAIGASSRTGKVISIARRANRPPSVAVPSKGLPVEDPSRSLNKFADPNREVPADDF